MVIEASLERQSGQTKPSSSITGMLPPIPCEALTQENVDRLAARRSVKHGRATDGRGEARKLAWTKRRIKKDRTDCLGPKYIIHISGCIVADNSAMSTRFLPHVEPPVNGLMNTG
ncbi:hypothetical protein ACVWYQ_005498 [Bradyrhizobium sp. USDA 3397]|uniref:hypothetical protein n=1 Tax=Bradyrhizobium sp. CCBAU 45321 TaxID=1641878 RepID=UPI002302FB90|nr:hypothetical protein [Bradyrhizobium sp. CCBAU 45321]